MSFDASNIGGSTGSEKAFESDSPEWTSGQLKTKFSVSAFTSQKPEVKQSVMTPDAQANRDRTMMAKITNDQKMSVDQAQPKTPESQNLSRTQNGIDETVKAKNNVVSEIKEAQKEIINAGNEAGHKI